MKDLLLIEAVIKVVPHHILTFNLGFSRIRGKTVVVFPASPNITKPSICTPEIPGVDQVPKLCLYVQVTQFMALVKLWVFTRNECTKQALDRNACKIDCRRLSSAIVQPSRRLYSKGRCLQVVCTIQFHSLFLLIRPTAAPQGHLASHLFYFS